MSDRDGITKDEFCARFRAHMVALRPNDPDIGDYADSVALSYWDDENLRECGPEECADEDISCMESD